MNEQSAKYVKASIAVYNLAENLRGIEEENRNILMEELALKLSDEDRMLLTFFLLRKNLPAKAESYREFSQNAKIDAVIFASKVSDFWRQSFFQFMLLATKL